MITRTSRGLVAAAAALVVLAGCSGADPAPAPGTGTSAAPGAAATAHAAADVAFVQGMIPHHEQAVAMADLAATRAASPEVQDLAGRIRAAQGPEIDRMNALLTGWGVPRPAPGSAMSGMGGMSGTGGMSGMMSPEQMRGLETATGAAFDRAFLEMMVAHHTGAVEMARTELDQGQSPEAKSLAREIIDTQQAEIAQMQVLLGRV